MSAIKLRDFFDTQSHIHLSSERKSQIFVSIKSKTIPTSTSRNNQLLSSVRYRRYFKTATSAVTAFVLMYLLYVPFSGPIMGTTNNTLIRVAQGPVVQAGYVGRLLSIQGEIQIMRQGVATDTSNLHDGDVVYLYNTSKADFVLKDGSQGTIEGPAQMTIVEQGSGGLILAVDHARYMQIDKAQPDQTESKNTDTDSQSDESDLIIETSTSRITTHKNTAVHLALVTTQDRQFIQNNGAQVTIESRGDNVSEIKQLASSHVAEVTDAVKVYNQVALIYDELKSNSLSTNYQIDATQVPTSNIKSLLTLEISKPITTPSKPILVALGTSESSTSESSDTGAITRENDARAMVALIALDTSATQPSSQPRITKDTGLTIATNNSAQVATTSDVLLDSIALSNENQKVEGINQEDITTVALLLGSDQGSRQTNTLMKDGSQQITGANPIILIKPLSDYQISLLTKISQGCTSTKQFRALQESFELKNTLTIEQTIASITQQYYLTSQLKTNISSLSICSDEKNSTN